MQLEKVSVLAFTIRNKRFLGCNMGSKSKVKVKDLKFKSEYFNSHFFISCESLTTLKSCYAKTLTHHNKTFMLCYTKV